MDFLNPSNTIGLDMTVRHAEVLVSANPEVKALAAKGDLVALHDKFAKIET